MMATQASGDFRSGAGIGGRSAPVTWPKRTRMTLPNGLQVVLAEAHSIPKFHGELYFRAGNALVVDRAPCLAEMTATAGADRNEQTHEPAN